MIKTIKPRFIASYRDAPLGISCIPNEQYIKDIRGGGGVSGRGDCGGLPRHI